MLSSCFASDSNCNNNTISFSFLTSCYSNWFSHGDINYSLCKNIPKDCNRNSSRSRNDTLDRLIFLYQPRERLMWRLKPACQGIHSPFQNTCLYLTPLGALLIFTAALLLNFSLQEFFFQQLETQCKMLPNTIVEDNFANCGIRSFNQDCATHLI